MSGMNKQNLIERQRFTGERALFSISDTEIRDSVFGDGESPLKHCRNLTVTGTTFDWKYPLWYGDHLQLDNCTFNPTARAGIWYSDHVSVSKTTIKAPKEFRRCKDLRLEEVTIPQAEETLWNCRDLVLDHVSAAGDYFGMGCRNVTMDHLELEGNYCFDGTKNVTVRNSRFLSKDCFWNCENVTVYDSTISGEYFAWNSRNVTLINCRIDSLQGLCYVDHLVMRNCYLGSTTLAFEYSSDIDAEISGRVESIINPRSGSIHADEIGTVILDPAQPVADDADSSKCENSVQQQGHDLQIFEKGIRKTDFFRLDQVTLVSGTDGETRLVEGQEK